MSQLRLLIIEDSEDDALLLVHELKRGGYHIDYCVVDNEADLSDALAEDLSWDMVISDHNLPGFSSEQALLMVNAAGRDTPVIIVSGSIGEDVAVEAMKTGANDYIMKHNLTRLVPAIERELREAENRKLSRRAQETIHHMAYHDALTGLANRHDFEQRLDSAILSAKKASASHILIYLDLDQFKVINDTCGHQAGDELLRQLAVLLRESIREGDGLARLGGDEFGLLLDSCTFERAEALANKILKVISDFRFSWEGKSFIIGVSMGLAVVNEHTSDVSEVMRSADIACYMAKDKGRNRYHIFSLDDKELTARHGEMEWVGKIHTALAEDSFVLYRQCIVPVSDQSNVNRYCEFLIRLRNDDGSIILPGAFLPAAERYNLMPKIDRWVINKAFSYLAQKFGDEATKENDYQFFINLSGASLNDDDFFDYIKQLLQEYGLYPGMLCFEITETVAISNLQEAVEFITDIRSIGCKIALDDFGTGLSSFSYLKAIPADFIKIDGNFIRDIVFDKMDRAIVEAIHQIAGVAGLKTIAEFVENDNIMNSVREIGIDYAQGYGIEMPRSINDECERS